MMLLYALFNVESSITLHVLDKFIFWLAAETLIKRSVCTYRTLEVLGPEHEFSLVNEDLKALPIADKVIKDVYGRIVNFVKLGRFTFGKELQLHVIEVKPNRPFKSPKIFEKEMYNAVLTVSNFLEKHYKAYLLGTGMHPTLRLEETGVWPHRHRQIYEALNRIFNVKQHGWLNIQSFQLNLPYFDEAKGVLIHNLLANVCTYLPAVAASSPIYEGCFGDYVDNRLYFYMESQREIPSITGNVVPEYINSFKQYRKDVIAKYSADLAIAGANKCILNKEWVNSRGVVLRFDRKALEIRVMDEQECVKSDVALTCFIRALLRGFMVEGEFQLQPTTLLVEDFKSVIRRGLDAEVRHPDGPTARHVCKRFLRTAWENATREEKEYLSLVEKRIDSGSLSDVIRRRVNVRAQKTSFDEAIVDVYSKLLNSLKTNEPFL
ncbi:MAG: glutamate-cysteine ligase family protein [Candidatus Bathyarchaeia archaeon]